MRGSIPWPPRSAAGCTGPGTVHMDITSTHRQRTGRLIGCYGTSRWRWIKGRCGCGSLGVWEFETRRRGRVAGGRALPGRGGLLGENPWHPSIFHGPTPLCPTCHPRLDQGSMARCPRSATRNVGPGTARRGVTPGTVVTSTGRDAGEASKPGEQGHRTSPANVKLPRRLLAQQVLHEVIPRAAQVVRLVGVAVGAVGEDEQIEILVVLDERVHHL